MCRNEEPNDLLCWGKISDTNQQHVHHFTSFGLIAVLLGLFGTVYIIDKVLPTPLMHADEQTHPDDFITGRARQDLKTLTDIGPKLAGTNQSEILAVNFLKTRINDIIHNSNLKLELDVQTFTDYRTGKTQYTNLVVKLFGRNNASQSVLINSHFDSAYSSPGASDDGINCAVMLEVMRKLSQSSCPSLNNLIFLFNGAEEIGFVGATKFVLGHKWANESKVVINLEAVGSGGKMILFQASPGAPWLFDYYRRVPHPYAQTAGEELYENEVLAAGTDFSAFRSYADLVGFDMAFFKNAERYHTPQDCFDFIPPGSFQHVGDNVLSLVRSLANAPEVGNPKDGDQRVIYYDFLGLFLITYNETEGSVINVYVSIMSVAVFILHLCSFRLSWGTQSLKYLVVSFCTIFGGWVVAMLCVVMTAFLLNQIGYSERWNSNPWIFFGLYTAPTVACSILLLPWATHDNLAANIKCQIQAHYVRILWTIMLIAGTVLHIRSVYLLLVPVLFNSISFLLIYVLKFQHSVMRWQIVYLGGLIIPTMFLMYGALLMLSVLIPASVRMHPLTSSTIVAAVAVIFTILITSPFVPLANLVKDVKFLYVFFTIVFLLNFILIFTPLFKIF